MFVWVGCAVLDEWWPLDQILVASGHPRRPQLPDHSSQPLLSFCGNEIKHPYNQRHGPKRVQVLCICSSSITVQLIMSRARRSVGMLCKARTRGEKKGIWTQSQGGLHVQYCRRLANTYCYAQTTRTKSRTCGSQSPSAMSYLTSHSQCSSHPA